MFSSSRERRYWLCAVAAIVAIYSTLGFTPLASAFLRDAQLLTPAFVAALLMIVAAVIAAGIRVRLLEIEVAVLLGIGAAYLLLFVRMEIPEERTHIVEYGVVALFLFEALAERFRNLGRPHHAAILAIATTAAVGTLDEIIQWTIPQRTFDLRDMAFNAIAATMAVGARVTFDWAQRRGRQIEPDDSADA